MRRENIGLVVRPRLFDQVGRPAQTVAPLPIPKRDQMNASVPAGKLQKACIADPEGLVRDGQPEDVSAVRARLAPERPESFFPVSTWKSFHRRLDKRAGLKRQ